MIIPFVVDVFLKPLEDCASLNTGTIFYSQRRFCIIAIVGYSY